MLKIKIIAIGSLKEKYWRESTEEYLKRLQKYANTEVLQLPEERLRDKGGPAEEEQVRKAEGERIIKALGSDEHVIILDIKGRKMNSPDLASYIEKAMADGTGRITFVIGGSLGLSREVIAKGRLSLSFSDMTFPHQLMRLILLEQIYRAFKIIKKEPYHK